MTRNGADVDEGEEGVDDDDGSDEPEDFFLRFFLPSPLPMYKQVVVLPVE